MFSMHKAPDYWRQYFKLADETADAGGRMFIQVHSRALNVGALVRDYDALRPAAGLARCPQAALGGAGSRAAQSGNAPPAHCGGSRDAARGQKIVGAEPRRANFKWLFVMDNAKPAPSVGR